MTWIYRGLLALGVWLSEVAVRGLGGWDSHPENGADTEGA